MTTNDAIREAQGSVYNGEALALIIDALERLEPKKVIVNTDNSWFECPNCGRVVEVFHNGTVPCCDGCYQVLDWSDSDV